MLLFCIVTIFKWRAIQVYMMHMVDSGISNSQVKHSYNKQVVNNDFIQMTKIQIKKYRVMQVLLITQFR